MAATSDDLFTGTLLVVAPHMDDEALACGGTIALHPDSERVHVVYATDGMKSPAPLPSSRHAAPSDLGAIRRRESLAAMGLLGVPATNLHFLDLPEAELPCHEVTLAGLLAEHIRRLTPDSVLVPFRYDRHPDHVAVNRVVTAAKQSGAVQGEVLEYFVYHRSRLLPRRDVRAYVRPESLLSVDISSVARRKRAALDCFATQTTRYYEWQTRPILQAGLLEEECAAPERFLRYDPALPGATIFASGAALIRIADRLEPPLVRLKYQLTSWLKSAR